MCRMLHARRVPAFSKMPAPIPAARARAPVHVEDV